MKIFPAFLALTTRVVRFPLSPRPVCQPDCAVRPHWVLVWSLGPAEHSDVYSRLACYRHLHSASMSVPRAAEYFTVTPYHGS